MSPWFGNPGSNGMKNEKSSAPVFFPNASALRKWFEKNHETQTELLVGFYKLSTGKPSVNWGQSVDEALCFGWIDGVRKSIDQERYTIRFTKRKASSNWSAINIRKMDALQKKGLLHPNGRAAFEKRQEKKSGIYAYENKPVKLSAAFQKKLKANKKAWAFFYLQAPSYQKTVIYRIMTAKNASTREKRLDTLINDSEAGLRIGPHYNSKKKRNDENKI